MKNLLLFFLLISTIFSKAQLSGSVQYRGTTNTDKVVMHFPDGATMNKIFVPPYPSIGTTATPFIAPGQVFTTVITNNSSHSVSLFPYLNRVGMENVAWGDSFLLAYLNSQIAGITDTDAIRLRLVQLVATKFEKTDLFDHGEVFFSPNDSNLYAKQNALTGGTNAAFHKQCSDYVRNAISILIKTGYFNSSNIRVVNLIGHVTCEFLYIGEWTYADFDPEEPFFMILDSENTNGFASALDIQNNRGLIPSQQQYYFVNDAGDSINLREVKTITPEFYRSRFDSVSTSPIPFDNAPLNISGIITIPAHARLEASYKMPYIVDSASLALLDTAAMDNLNSAYLLISQILQISEDSAITLMRTFGVSFMYNTQTWQPDYTGITPTIKIILPTTADTIGMGYFNENINFCGYVIGSNSTIYLGDTIYSPGEVPSLWTSSNSNISPLTSDGQCNYLANNGGYIPPHLNKADTISVSYNPKILNFGTGFQLGYADGDSIGVQVYSNDGLIADSSYGYHGLNFQPITKQSEASLTVPQHNNTEDRSDDLSGISSPISYNINIYPNPTADNIHIIISGTEELIAILYDMTGNAVGHYPISLQNNIVNVTGLSDGVYTCILTKNQLPVYSKEIIIFRN